MGMLHDGQVHHLALILAVPGVFGVDRHAGITQHCFGPGGGDRYKHAGLPFNGIADVVQLAVVLLVIHFQIG